MKKMHLIVLIAVLLPMSAWSRDFPIILKVSDQNTPPLPRTSHTLIGYWDVDDYEGSKKSNIKSKLKLDGRVVDIIDRCSYGTFTSIERPGGCYMASLGIDRNNLHKITDLRITASNNPIGKILKKYPFKSGNVHHPDRNKRRYLIGVWDVDGGGGHGNDGSAGKYGMSLEAEFRNTKSQRKLLDLVLVASNNKGPKIRKGYDIIGYWDVDRGGSRGTNGSTGTYMMTLLAKWSR